MKVGDDPSRSPTGLNAVVFSGGGALGAYEVGILKALTHGLSPATNYRPLEPDIYSGTSVGAYNATFMAAEGTLPGPQAVARLEKVWLKEIALHPGRSNNGVYRYRLNPFQLLNPIQIARQPLQLTREAFQDFFYLSPRILRRLTSLIDDRGYDPLSRFVALIDISLFISTEPLRRTLHRTIDFNKVRESPKKLIVAATKWRFGQVLLADNSDFNDRLGPKIVRGSASIPGIFPPAGTGNDELVDGGVLMNLPLGPAIKAGAQNIFILDLFPKSENLMLAKVPSTVGTILRSQTINWDQQLRQYGRDVRAYNLYLDILDYLHALKNEPGWKGQRFAGIRPRIQELEERLRADLKGRPGRSLTIHRFRPQHPLLNRPLGMLNFNVNAIRKHIHRGFKDAKRHDCKESGCVTL